jgi:hypothetical protein
MKNIHVLQTDQPSRLVLRDVDNKLILHTPITQWHGKSQNIYITNSEEIKDGDWYYDLNLNKIKKALEVESDRIYYTRYHCTIPINAKKIILTTDQKLIKDGVQAIDDEFLQWFVQNSSCEWISVENHVVGSGFTHIGKTPSKKERLRGCYDNGEQITGKWEDCYKYKIIIPSKEQTQLVSSNEDIIPDYSQPKSHLESILEKLDKEEEPKQEYPTCGCGSNWFNITAKNKPFCFKCGKGTKQETLEEAAETYSENWEDITGLDYENCVPSEINKIDFKAGAKWQQENLGLNITNVREYIINYTNWLSEQNLMICEGINGYTFRSSMIGGKKYSADELYDKFFSEYKKNNLT